MCTVSINSTLRKLELVQFRGLATCSRFIGYGGTSNVISVIFGFPVPLTSLKYFDILTINKELGQRIKHKYKGTSPKDFGTKN